MRHTRYIKNSRTFIDARSHAGGGRRVPNPKSDRSPGAMGFTVHRSTGVVHTVLGGVGPVDDFDPVDFEVLDGVKECHRIVSPYKLASRHFKPGGTVVKVKGVEVGGNNVVVMAGPCSVEN